MGLQLHPEDLARVLLHFVERLRDLHAAPLAAPTGMDLGLYHPDLAAQFLRGLYRLFHAEAGITGRRRDAVLAQDLLRLIFVDFQDSSRFCFAAPRYHLG